jgi:DNA-binding NarL/FixJ family response regulator
MYAAAKTCIRVLLVDDHRSVLWGLGKLVDSAQPRMRTIGMAASGAEALAAVRSQCPDVVLLDLDLGADNGLEVMADILCACDAKVLILTGAGDPALRERAVVAGAKGIVHKAEPAEVILNAIERVHRGEIWLDRSTTAKVLASLSGQTKAPQGDGETAALTRKEREIVVAVVEHRGAPIKVIANRLHLSAHTVRNHLASIYGKLGVSGRLELYMYAQERGLARAEPRASASASA